MQLWDLDTRSEVQTKKAHNDFVTQLLHPPGKPEQGQQLNRQTGACEKCQLGGARRKQAALQTSFEKA